MEVKLTAWGLSLAWFLGVTLSLAHAGILRDEILWEQGRKHLAEGRAKEAKEAFQSLAQSYPRDSDLELMLAMVSLRLRDLQAAEVHVRRALGFSPDHVEALTLLGWIYLELKKDHEAAIVEYAKVVKLRPDSPAALNNLGVALKRKGELENALESFDHALKLRPDYGEALSNRGWIYIQQKRWRDARRDFEEALKINPHDEGALYGLSRALREARDYSGAQAALRSLIQRSPNFVYWLEWSQVQLVRYYWVFLWAAAGIFLYSRYIRRIKAPHKDKE